mgnify:CR=1 FL=1|jgi:hypothetical protein
MNVHGLASSAPDILGTINGAMNLFTPSMYPGDVCIIPLDAR